MKFALAPLQWLATEDGGMDRGRALPLATLVSETRRLGFDALKAEPPDELTVAEYATALAAGGLTPAPGYLPAELEEAAARDRIVAQAGAPSRRESVGIAPVRRDAALALIMAHKRPGNRARRRGDACACRPWDR